MTPIIELTKQRHFAGWETGIFNLKTTSGGAVLFAEADYSKPKVLFDYEHQANSYKYLFILNPGFKVARVQINALDKGQYRMHLSLLEIEELFIEQVQGNPVARAEFKTRFMLLKLFKSLEEILSMDFYESHVPENGELSKEFLKASITKALTPPDQQKLFWGVPRQNKNLD